MADIVSKKKRSELMSGIKSKDTRPEVLIRKNLHSKGYRYKLHDKSLPGKPDLALPKFNTIINIHGCFWHKHTCHLFKWPSTREEFWRIKLEGNAKRDLEINKLLREKGWRIITVWECALTGKSKRPLHQIIQTIILFLESETVELIIEGKTLL